MSYKTDPVVLHLLKKKLKNFSEVKKAIENKFGDVSGMKLSHFLRKLVLRNYLAGYRYLEETIPKNNPLTLFSLIPEIIEEIDQIFSVYGKPILVYQKVLKQRDIYLN